MELIAFAPTAAPASVALPEASETSSLPTLLTTDRMPEAAVAVESYARVPVRVTGRWLTVIALVV